MASTIQIKRNTSSGQTPQSLAAGELAVNVFDRKLYVGNNASGVTGLVGEDFKITTQTGVDGGIGGSGQHAHIKLFSVPYGNTRGVVSNTIALVGDDAITVAKAANGAITFALDNDFGQSFPTDSGTGTPSSHALTIAGGEGIDTSASGATVTIAGEEASTSNKGVASFSSDNFSVSSGVVTIKDNGVIMGTETTGNYVATIAGTSNEISVSGSGSETAAVTIGLPDDVTIAGQLNVSENIVVAGNTIVNGNLTVEGATTYVSTSTVKVDDSMLILAANNSGHSVDAGVYQKYVSSGTKYAGYFFDASDNVFKFFKETGTEPTTTVNTSASGYALAQLDAVIDGGTF